MSKKTITTILMVCLYLTSSAFASDLDQSTPIVGNWEEAVNDKGLVRIPLQNAHGFQWFASLRMGKPWQKELFCVLENNHALNMVWPIDCEGCPQPEYGYNYKDSKLYFHRPNNDTTVLDDGFTATGHFAMDRMCMGMYGSTVQMRNQNSTVCEHQLLFFYVTNTTSWDWDAKVTSHHKVQATCGLGKEKATNTSQGLIAKAVNAGSIRRNAYSITLVPQELAAGIEYEKTLPQDRDHEMQMKTSYLTLGGWDEQDYVGEIRWMDTGDSWNQTLSNFKFNDETIANEYDLVQIQFEVGYPYIGMSSRFYDKIAETLNSNVRGMECENFDDEHWGVCRAKGKKCEQLNLEYQLLFTINDYEFSIPLKNIAVNLNETDDDYCYAQIAVLPNSDNSIVLGSSFFTAFVGIFDTENDRIGFAESHRALPGSSITCIGQSCGSTPVLPPHGTDTEPGEGTSMSMNAVFLIIAILVIAILTCGAVFYCKRRSKRNKETDRVHERSSRGKKGYQMHDEKDDDSDEEDNLQIDYAKPMINN